MGSGMGKGRAVHRLVWIIYVVRALAFVWAFCAIGLHAWERGFGAGVWVALVLQFLVYPHLLYVRSIRASDQKAAEFQHLYVDSLLWGLWIPALEFPVWIAYALVSASTLNAIVNLGLPGLAKSVVATSVGLAVGLALFGYHLSPSTSAIVTAMCFFGSLAYTVGVGFVVHRQTMRLAASRAELARKA